MLSHHDMHLVKEGTALVCIGGRGTYTLTDGKVYYALFGAEEGIFSSRPFVSVIGDDSEQHTWHLSRFKLKDSNDA